MRREQAHPNPQLREVVAGLAQARDAQITRVVAMVDDLPNRGEADGLIAPLRARLAHIRPARPFGFARLLFSPLDPVIVPGIRWRRGEVGVPRQALAPLALAVQTALPALSNAVGTSAHRVAPDDRPAIAALGAALWPAASEILQQLAVPPNWTQISGLVAADFTQLAQILASLLREAPEVERLAASRTAPDDKEIRAVLSRTEPAGSLALATMVSILLCRMPVPSRVLSLASDIVVSSGVRSPAADRAVDHTLACLQASMVDADNGDATEAAIEAARVASLLTGLEESAQSNPDRRRRLEQIRREADALCRRRFEKAVAITVSQATESLAIQNGDEAFAQLEASARDLRRLESAGRRLGSGEHYDALVQSVAAQFHDQGSGLELVDRVRMVEILSGPDEALALLRAQQG